MISVLIPTANRPDYLRHSLESVIYQSRKDLIGEVIVSNNGTISVADVVSSFTSLPIQFIEQSEKLRPGAHFEWLVNRARFPLIAMLADDDMWGRYHLEESYRLLDRYPDAVAVFSQTVAVRNACRQPINGYAQLVHSFSDAPCPLLDEAYVFGRGDLIVDALIRTPLNVWSMLAKRESVLKHIGVFSEADAGIDLDRFFLWRLNSEGAIVAAREVGLFMRCHPQMAGTLMSKSDPGKYDEITKRYSRQMVAEALGFDGSLRSKWADFWQSITPGERDLIVNQSYPGCIQHASEALGEGPFKTPISDNIGGKMGRAFRDCLPPLLARQLRKLREFTNRNSVS
jgi:hypothetical protein